MKTRKWAIVTLKETNKDDEIIAKFRRNGDAHIFAAKIAVAMTNRNITNTGEIILDRTDRERYHYPIGG